MTPLSPRDLIRACPDLREPERRRLLGLDDAVLHKLHVEWTLPHATTARVAGALAGDHVSFDNVKHYRTVLQGRRAPTQSAEVTAGRKPPPSGEERRRGHVEPARLAPSGVADEMPAPMEGISEYQTSRARRLEYAHMQARLRRAVSKR